MNNFMPPRENKNITRFLQAIEYVYQIDPRGVGGGWGRWGTTL